MELAEVLGILKKSADRARLAGMARYGIETQNAWGVALPALRRLARQIGKDHPLAAALWKCGIHEARIMASLVGDPGRVTRRQLDRWVRQVDSWDVGDQLVNNLVRATPLAWDCAWAWSAAEPEFVKRAGFALFASLAVHDKSAPDAVFLKVLERVAEEAEDGRNMVKKAVNWALRQIGKRNPALHAAANRSARRLQQKEDRTARWIGNDALRDLASQATADKFARQARKVPRGTK